MTITLRLVLVVLAFLCFALDTAGVQARLNLQSAGLALLTLAWMVA